MKRLFAIVLLTLGAVAMLGCGASTEEQVSEIAKPYKTGYLKVDALHEIFYALGGNPDGIPVMVLHGGPGGSCGPYMFDYFNLERYHVILHDQRGAGQSRPTSELTGNNTQSLVADIEALRNHLELEKVVLYGGSWGTTLALAYAETYPDNVSGIILRGVFTATKREIDDFYHGATAAFFPEVFERLQKILPDPDTHNYPEQLLALIQSDDPEIRNKAAREWARYEGKLAFLHIEDDKLEALLNQFGPATYTFSLMENWYMTHNCFLAENQLLDNAHKIAHIPTIIVHGRYDMVCRPRAAYALAQRLDNCQLWFVPESGHTSMEPAMLEHIKRATRELQPLGVE